MALIFLLAVCFYGIEGINSNIFIGWVNGPEPTQLASHIGVNSTVRVGNELRTRTGLHRLAATLAAITLKKYQARGHCR